MEGLNESNELRNAVQRVVGSVLPLRASVAYLLEEFQAAEVLLVETSYLPELYLYDDMLPEVRVSLAQWIQEERAGQSAEE